MNSRASRRVGSSNTRLAEMASMLSHACSMYGRKKGGSARSRSMSAEMASRETSSSVPPCSDACSTRSRLGTSAWKPARARAASLPPPPPLPPPSSLASSDEVMSAMVPCMAATRTA